MNGYRKNTGKPVENFPANRGLSTELYPNNFVPCPDIFIKSNRNY